MNGKIHIFMQHGLFSGFIENTKGWLSDVGHPHVQSNGTDDEHPPDNLSVASD